MPSIEKIKYNGHSATLLLDDGTQPEVPYSSIEELHLETGKDLSPEEVERVRDASERFRCRNSALKSLSLRSHSRSELVIKLKKKNFKSGHIETTLEQLAGSGYIDDHEYALRFIRNRTSRKVVGEIYLRKELFQRGVAANIIEQALDETGSREVDIQRVINEAEKKLISIKNKNNKKSRLVSFLSSRGFNSSVIQKTLEKIHPDNFSEN